MKFHRLSIVLISAIAVSTLASAQVGKLGVADQAFLDLQVAARPLAIAPPAAGERKTREDFERDRKMQSTAFLAAADQARDFYTKYPAHEKAAEAKKIEAVSTLRAVQTGSTENEPKALRLAREYRSDSANPSLDRYHVATVVTQIEISKKHITERTELMAEYEKRALDLYGEFPNEPAVIEMLLGVARNADPAQARSVAAQILRMPATDSVKREAQAVIDRLDMPGKTIELEWQDDTAKFYKLSDLKGKTVVFYIWSTWTAASAASNERIASDLKSGVELISVNVDTQIEKGRSARTKAPFSALSSYYDDRGLNGPLPKQLKAHKVPSVYVVDGSGVFIGSGSPSELPGLLKKAGK